MVCVLCCVVATCYWYGFFTVWWCGIEYYVWFVYWMVVWQHVIDILCELCGDVATFNMYVMCNMLWFVSMT